jgi:hypothetical protein
MPEAAVNKYRYPGLREHQVGVNPASWHVQPHIHAVSVSDCVEGLSESHLWAGVASPIGAHALGGVGRRRCGWRRHGRRRSLGILIEEVIKHVARARTFNAELSHTVLSQPLEAASLQQERSAHTCGNFTFRHHL